MRLCCLSVIALPLYACSNPTSILVEVEAGPEIVASSLVLTVSADGTDAGVTQSLPTNGAPLLLPNTVLIHTPDVAWNFALTLSGKDNAGQSLIAQTTVQTIPHEQVAARLTLGHVAPDGGARDGSLVDATTSDAPIALCANGARDPNETDIDCGGDCPPCDVARKCISASDCQTAFCDESHVCALVSGPPRWIPVAPLPTARAALASASSDGGIYALGGHAADDAGATPLNASEIYFPDADKWVALPNAMPTARSGLAAAAFTDGRVVAVGGTRDTMILLPTTELYSPSTSQWTPSQDLPSGRVGLGAALSSADDLYVIGGLGSGIDWSVDVDELRPSGNWLSVTPLPEGRAFAAITNGPDSRLYAIGGQTSTGFLATAVAAAPGQAWSAIAPLGDYRVFATAMSAPDGRIYLVGGDSGTPMVTPTLAYSPASNTWTIAANLNTWRKELSGAVGVDGRLYAIGGSDGNGAVYANVEAYGPVIALSTPGGAAGDLVQLSGDNFAIGATVRVYFGASATAAGTGTTDASGVLTAPIAIRVPNLPKGAYRVRAIDDRSRYPVSAPFSIQ
jgi:hypothetical protein